MSVCNSQEIAQRLFRFTWKQSKPLFGAKFYFSPPFQVTGRIDKIVLYILLHATTQNNTI